MNINKKNIIIIIVLIILFTFIPGIYLIYNTSSYFGEDSIKKDEQIIWPPVSQSCPDYWKLAKVNGNKYCINNRNLGNDNVGILPKVSVNKELMIRYPKYSQFSFYGINTKTPNNNITGMMTPKCYSYEQCKCPISNYFCVPWTGVVNEDNCNLTCNNNNSAYLNNLNNEEVTGYNGQIKI